MLDSNLSWNDHICYISAKILSRLGMLCKAHKVIPREALSYYTMPCYFFYLTIAVLFGEAVGKQIGIT